MRFQLDQKQFVKFKKELILKTTPLALFPLAAVFLFTKTDGTTALIMIPLFLAILFFVMKNSIKKQKKAWETFELTIDELTIVRVQEGFPNISISKNDIIEAIEAKNGAIVLITKPKSSSIIIPFSVNNKAELIEVISTFTTIKKAKSNQGLLLLYGSSIISIVVFFSFMLSTNFFFTIASGLILLTFFLWGFIVIQRNKNIETKVKLSSYLLFILVIVIISKLVTAINQYL